MKLLQAPVAIGLSTLVGGAVGFTITNNDSAVSNGSIIGASGLAALATYHTPPAGATIATGMWAGIAIGGAINLARKGVDELG